MALKKYDSALALSAAVMLAIAAFEVFYVVRMHSVGDNLESTVAKLVGVECKERRSSALILLQIEGKNIKYGIEPSRPDLSCDEHLVLFRDHLGKEIILSVYGSWAYEVATPTDAIVEKQEILPHLIGRATNKAVLFGGGGVFLVLLLAGRKWVRSGTMRSA